MASVDVDVPGGTATVTMQPGTSLTRQACEQALAGTQYTVTGFQARPAG